MQTIRKNKIDAIEGSVLTLGNFDGLHTGHMKIIRKVVRDAKALGLPSLVYTFDPHPLKVVAPDKCPPLIMTLAEKELILAELGVDYMVPANFTKEFAMKDAREFVEDVLVDGLKAREVVVGHDYAFGRGKRGTIAYLRKLSLEFGFKLSVLPAYKKGGHVVSSSRVRELVTGGKLRAAAELLGRDFAVSGKVVRGRGIGKGIGCPTANLSHANELLPKSGVYAVYATLGSRRLPAVANIGVSPTFGAGELTLEVHIPGFSEEIYGRTLQVTFIRRLRGEREFPSKEALMKRITRDIDRALAIL